MYREVKEITALNAPRNLTLLILLANSIFMNYLAYVVDGMNEQQIDISRHISVLKWGKSLALRINSSEGKAIIMNFFQTHRIHLIYGPKGNEAGMTKLQQQVHPVSNFETPIVGAIFYFNT
ncbi:MAG: hypothetical protein EOP04_32985, partial [Proteobacteria bacterium]